MQGSTDAHRMTRGSEAPLPVSSETGCAAAGPCACAGLGFRVHGGKQSTTTTVTTTRHQHHSHHNSTRTTTTTSITTAVAAAAAAAAAAASTTTSTAATNTATRITLMRTQLRLTL